MRFAASLIALLFPLFVQAQPCDPSHALWAKVLKEFVSALPPATFVDYQGLKSRSAGLDEYLKALESVSEAEYQKLPKLEKEAFLINVYNANAVKLAVEGLPRQTIQSELKKERFKLRGKKTSLEALEKTLLKDFGDSHILFALNPASRGRPNLRAEPYLGGKLKAQLDEATRDFLNDMTRNYFSPKETKLFLSDVLKGVSGAKAFVAPYMGKDAAERKLINGKDTDIEYLPSEGSLNIKGAGVDP